MYLDAPDPDRKYALQIANVAVCDTVAYNLLIDLELLFEMAKEMTEPDGKGDSRGYQALYTGNEIINAIQAGNMRYIKIHCMLQYIDCTTFFKGKHNDCRVLSLNVATVSAPTPLTQWVIAILTRHGCGRMTRPFANALVAGLQL